MRRFWNGCKSLIADEAGLETVEYAIITGLIVAATIGAIAAIGGWVSGQFNNLANTLTGQ